MEDQKRTPTRRSWTTTKREKLSFDWCSHANSYTWLHLTKNKRKTLLLHDMVSFRSDTNKNEREKSLVQKHAWLTWRDTLPFAGQFSILVQNTPYLGMTVKGNAIANDREHLNQISKVTFWWVKQTSSTKKGAYRRLYFSQSGLQNKDQFHLVLICLRITSLLHKQNDHVLCKWAIGRPRW